MMPADSDVVMLLHRVRGDTEPQAMPVLFSVAVDAMRTLDEIARGVSRSDFVDIPFKTSDGRLGHMMIRADQIVEFAWSELPANG